METENKKYEEAMKELEQIVSQMERGNLDLDAMVPGLKRAQELITYCKARLTKTDEEINRLLSPTNDPPTTK